MFAEAPDDATFDQQLRNARMELTVSRFSPETLYDEASTALLLPEVRSLDILTQEDLDAPSPASSTSPRASSSPGRRSRPSAH